MNSLPIAATAAVSLALFGADGRGIVQAGAGPDLSAASGSGPAQIGERYPALELDAVDGTLVNARRLAGQPFIVDFFATWCQPCHQATADLRAVLTAPGGAPPSPPVILVDLGESPETVKNWAAKATLPPNAIVTLDPQGIAARRWGARRLPTTFLVDAGGVVRHINRGWGSGYRERMARWLRALAAPRVPAAP